MSEREGGKFEGMVVARLRALEEHIEELLRAVRRLEGRVMADHAAHAALASDVRALGEKANFNTRAIWSAVAGIVAAAAGMVLAMMGMAR